MEVRVGVAALTTVKLTEFALFAPPEFVVLICLVPVVDALSRMFSVAVTWVSLTTTTLVAVIFRPETVTAVVPVRPEPVIVTGTLLPLVPWIGAMEVSLGCTMVKVTVSVVVPPAAVTVTFLAPELAFPAITKVAVIWVVLLVVNEETVTRVPETLIELTPMKFVPVRTTLVYVSP
jgi:hypothetical protein